MPPPPALPFDRRWARPAVFVLLCATTVATFAWASSNDGEGEGDVEKVASAPRPTTTTTIGYRTPTSADPLRVLVAGDSLVGWIAPGLTSELDDEPVDVIDDWKGSTGLVRDDYFDWPARLTADMAQHDPDVVILGFGGNDTQGLTTDDGVLPLGTPEWATEYQRRIGEVLDIVEAPGRSVYWIELPLTRSELIEETRPVFEAAIAAEAADRPWVHLVDSSEALSPDGTFVSELPDESGDLQVTMAPDDIHPSAHGGTLIVGEFLPDLLEAHHVPT